MPHLPLCRPALALAAIGVALTADASRADVLFVHRSATGAANGSSWANAFTRLEAALAAAAPGDEVWVAAGVYTPADAASSFVLKSAVGVFGGFAGTETSRSQRDPAANLTVLSGDIGQDDTVQPQAFWPYNVILNTANAGHVVEASGVDPAAVLDGFRIEKGAYGPFGTPAGNPLHYGSGVYCVGGSPTIANCDFRDNLASFGHGGGVHLVDSGALVRDCTFDHCLAYQGSGGGIFVGGASSATIQDCTFTANLAVSSYGQTGQGGAVQLNSSLPVTIARCRFIGNTARAIGVGGYETPRGGAVSSFSLGSQTIIRECSFRNNQASLGGGLFVWNPTTVLNCAFDHNTAAIEGGGIGAQWTTLTLLNSTIAHNTGEESAGVMILETPPNFPALAVIRNTIIWGNTALGQDVSPRNAGIRGPRDAEYCCIQDLFTVEPGEDPIDPANFPGCIAVNPLLANAAAGDLRLLEGSPCIDAGDNSAVPAQTPTDLDGLPRIARGLPGPGPAVVDMGAYEFAAGPSDCPADYDTNGAVEVLDIFTFLTDWFASEPAAYGFGGTPGVPAIFAFLTAWFAGCP